MKTNNKSLLIHHDTASDKTASEIVEEKDIIEKTKEFLKKLAMVHKKTNVSVYYPLGVVMKATDDKQEYAYAIAYEKEKFVIVVPNGTAASAKLYGNWHEALVYAQRILADKRNPDKKIHIILDQYTHKNH